MTDAHTEDVTSLPVDDEEEPMKVLVESLKLYVTLSLALAAAFLAAARDNHMSYAWMLWPTGLLVVAAAISIGQLNHHVYWPNVQSGAGKTFNVIALLFMASGIISAVVAVVVYVPATNAILVPNAPGIPGVVIDGNSVHLSGDVKTKVSIKRDVSGNILTIEINP